MIRSKAGSQKLKTRIVHGPIRLKSTQIHKTKKTYDRKKVKKELKTETN